MTANKIVYIVTDYVQLQLPKRTSRCLPVMQAAKVGVHSRGAKLHSLVHSPRLEHARSIIIVRSRVSLSLITNKCKIIIAMTIAKLPPSMNKAVAASNGRSMTEYLFRVLMTIRYARRLED